MKTISGLCPICDAPQHITSDVQVSEVIICSDCRNRLVIDTIDQDRVALSQAPAVEEDWGE